MRCETLKVDVDLTTCKIDQDRGADELKVLWTDINYKPEQNAFYYARVLQNPTCRWTTYDNIRAGRKPPKEYSATMTEMAWKLHLRLCIGYEPPQRGWRALPS